MAQLEILHPVAEILPASVSAARRPGSLDGTTVGLFWNSKAGGDVALRAAAEELARRHDGITFRHYVGSVGSTYRQATPEDVQRMTAECDAVIGSSGD